jgi:hypothetical protein
MVRLINHVDPSIDIDIEINGTPQLQLFTKC